MNSSAYVFGNLGEGYTQYPEDYAHEIYEEFQLKAEAPSQVIIHRDKSIMYYGYVRKLDGEGQYIGPGALGAPQILMYQKDILPYLTDEAKNYCNKRRQINHE